jgi:hypothetical protein
MIVLELHRLIPGPDDSGGSRIVARLTADDQGVRLEPNDFELDLSQQVVNLRTGEPISVNEDAEEWARGLVASLRTPYLWAEIKEDSNPLSDVDIERVEIEDPAWSSTPALH